MSKKLKVAPIFSSHMVLQREKAIRIWGEGNNGDRITVAIGENNRKAVVKEGKWMVSMPSMKAGGPVEVKVTNGVENINFVDVMIGDVWLAGGQSNMELELQNCKNGKEELEQANNKNLRIYYTLQQSYIDEEAIKKEEENSWQVCSSDTAARITAVGYFYGRELTEELNIPIGIIGCNWGGTSASAWISREMLERDEETRTYVNEYDEAVKNYTLDEYDKLRDKYFVDYDKWKVIADKLYEENPEILWSEVLKIAGECPYPEPLGPKSPFRAAGLYETMLKRVAPYTLKGFIYYQGESDDHKPTTYGNLLTMLIDQWRRDWMDYELPFLYVQLPMYIARGDEDRKNWAILREQQMKVHKTIKNTGLAVVLDCGEFNNIHPLDKQTVGHRLALQALYHVYKKDIEAYGPLYQSIEINEEKAILTFKHAEDGFIIKGDHIVGFEIAGDDQVFYKANVKIEGEKIIVKAPEVEAPEYVRYQWTNYDEVTVFGQNGIPLAPFRSNEFMEY